MTQPRPRSAAGRAPSIKMPARRAHARHRAGMQVPRPPRPPLDRRTALSRVLALWPSELDDVSAAGRLNVVAKLRRALRAERRRGIAGHWTYDLARHVELLHLYRQELALLKAAGTMGGAARPAVPSIR